LKRKRLINRRPIGPDRKRKLAGDDSGISFDGLDPVLGSLGILVGLLSESPGPPGSYTLVPDWFTDPITKTKKGITENPDQFQSLLAQVLGKVGGNAIGIPIDDPALLGTWYPIRYGQENTGFYLVTYTREQGGNNETVFGLGILHAWEVPSNSPLLKVDVWGLLPFVSIGSGSFKPTFGNPGYPISIGVAAEGNEPGKPLVDINGVSFNGVKFSALIDLASSTPFSVSLEVLSLLLPGDPVPSNRSLADLAAITSQQMLETATSLFTGALSKAFPGQEALVQYIGPLFGIGSSIPGNPSLKMPLLPWYDLFKAASDPVAFPGGIAALFYSWFNTISSDSQLLQAWIGCLAGFIGNTTPNVTGNGSRATPFAVSLIAIPAIGNLEFTVATVVTDTGTRYFYPGLGFTGTDIPLGTSEAVFVIAAELELAKFALSDQGVSASTEVSFDFNFSLNNKTAGQPLMKYDDYSFGSLKAGLSLAADGKLMPFFVLNQVVTPQSSFEQVNLLSPSELANTGAAVLSNALSTLIGVGQKSFSDNIAALIGLIVPGSAGADWPTALAPPFAPLQMVDSIINPIGAWSGYYLKVLNYTQPVDGKPAFSYLVKELALLLQNAASGTAVTIDGDGTKNSPWRAAISVSDQTLPAYLTAYTSVSSNESVELVFGLMLGPAITVGGTLIVPSVGIEAIRISFPAPASGLSVKAAWFPQIGAFLTLPNGFQTPPVAGVVVSVSAAQLSAQWANGSGWGWSMFVDTPALIIDGTQMSLGQNLNFDDTQSLEDLVKKSAATFSPFMVATLGTILTRTETRPGLFVAGALGFLADISKSLIFPKGLDWTGFTALQLNDLSNPWPDVRARIAENFATADTSRSVLSLLAWAIDSTLAEAPATPGAGSFEMPYATQLPKGFAMPVWYDAIGKVLGMGLGREDKWSYQGVFDFALDSRLNVLKYDLQHGQLIFDQEVPSFIMLGTLANPNGPLIDLPGSLGTLGKAQIGFTLSMSSGVVLFAPVVNLLEVTLPGQAQKTIITLADFLATDFEAALQSAFVSLLNAGVQAGIDQVKDKDLFKTLYELLALLGLTLERTSITDPYGINSAGWNGLIADFNTYIQSQLLALLSQPASRSKLFSFIEEILHVNLPDFPVPALELLTGLAICGPAEEGYPLYPKALLELATDPLASLKQRFVHLFDPAYPEALAKLTAALTRNIPEMRFGNFTFGSNANGVITLSVQPENAYTIGEFMRVSGFVSLDLNNRVLTAVLDPFINKVGITLHNEAKLQFVNQQFTPAFLVAAVWGDGSKPSAKSLDLLPFNSSRFLDQLAALAPAYVLNVLLNSVVEEQLLKKYPLIQQIFTGLGLATDQGSGASDLIRAGLIKEGDALWEMSSLMGILRDPLGWLLSDTVMGLNGKFNIGALVKLLTNLPAVSSANGISVHPTANGAEIKGLPYGFVVDMSGDNGTASFGFSTSGIVISEDWGLLDKLAFQVSIDANYQPAFSGGLVMASGTKIPVPFYLGLGYDKAFLLSISQGKPAAPTGLSVQLLPFAGWGTLAEQAAQLAAAAALKELVPQLLQKLSDAGAKDFVDRMTSFGNLMDVTSLVDQIIALIGAGGDTLKKIEAAALAWLEQRFTASSAPNTVDALIALLSGVLSGLSKEQGRLVFQPSASIPVVIKSGLNADGLLGLWAGLTLPTVDLLKIDIAETGVGVNISDGSLVFSFGLQVVIPVDGDNGPALALDYVASKGFVLVFDPLGDQSDFSKHSSLSRELMPAFFPGAGSLSDRVTSWLLDVFKIVLPRYVAALILNIDSVKSWLEAPIVSTATNAPTPATLLEAVSLVIRHPNGTYSLNSIEAISQLTPASFFGNLFYTLMQNELTLLTFGKHDQCSISVGPRAGMPGYYGLRLMAPNLETDALPNIVLQLGDNATGADEWIVQTKGPAGEPGIGFFVPLTKSAEGAVTVDFTLFQLLLYNLGFDFKGTNGNPLVNLNRFKIGKIGPRVVFELDFKGAAQPSLFFGAAVNLDQIGLSLAPDQMVSGGGTNPIASNILGSGTDTSAGNPPTNPSFSVTAAYCNSLWINLQSDTGNGSEVLLPVQRAFGPLYIDSLGLDWKNEPRLLDFLFSGTVDLAGLRAEVVRLKVEIPTKTPTDFAAYNVDMDGLDISFKGGSVTINGGFLKTETKDPVTGKTEISYTGVAVIKAGTFSLLALGSYAQVPVSQDPGAPTAPSLFIFAVLTTPLGGPPAFFVTAIAAGFSYNRSIQLPPIDKVQDFPLVRGLSDGSFSDGQDPTSGLEALAAVVKPEVGEYWLAAGVKFTSFELITSSVLLFLSFGKDWEVNILGLSFASLPPGIPKNAALAYFELALKISFKPAEGIISAEAQLTPNSFVLSTDCKVTGGFAFYLWYKDITTPDYHIPQGDFVITLGGYHPAFQKPVYYPDVPRLGMQWKMEISVGKISINGGAYFALCPTAVMAGGYLNVTFEMGPLKAWLDAYANFLIEWKPFYFNVGIGITVGASFGTVIAGVSVTLKAELGAKLNLEGPPTHGSVEVDWYVISFTIPIGSGKNATDDNNLNWKGFAEAFLPADAPPPTTDARGKKVLTQTLVQQVVKWKPETGLLNSTDSLWTIQPYPFSFSVQSAIPASTVTVSKSGVDLKGVPTGVRPMGYTADLNSPLTLAVIDGKGADVDLAARNIVMTANDNGAPAALWSKQSLNREQAPDPATMLIPGAIFGLVFGGNQYVFNGDIVPFAISNLAFTEGASKLLPFKNVAKYPPADRYPAKDQTTAYHVIMNSVMDPTVIVNRNLIFQALAASAIDAPLSPGLSVMASSADNILQALPVIARIGIYQNNGIAAVGAKLASAKPQGITKVPDLRIAPPKLQGILRRYRTGGKGRAGQPDVKCQWMETERVANKRAMARNIRALGARDNADLNDGAMVLWKLDDRSTTAIFLEGEVPVHVSCFDRYGELLVYRYCPFSIQFDLPHGAAQVAIQANLNQAGAVSGWRRDSILLKINPVWAMSDNGLVRVQNSQRIHCRGGRNRVGLIDTEDMLENNNILGGSDIPQQGWLQSVFTTHCRYIGVLVDGAHVDHGAISFSVETNRVPLKENLSQPLDIRRQDNGTLFLFGCPARGDGDEYYGVLVVPADKNVRVRAMYGFSNLPANMEVDRIVLPLAGQDLSVDIRPTNIRIQTINVPA
jgi:hypothetical protein